MDKRTLSFVAIGILIFVGWQYFAPKKTNPIQETTSLQAVTEQVKIGQTVEMAVLGSKAVLGSGGPAIMDWQLTGYTESQQSKVPVNLKTATHVSGGLEFLFDAKEFEGLKGVEGKLSAESDGTFVWTYSNAQVDMRRVFRASPDKSYLEGAWSFKFKGTAPKFAYISISGRTAEGDPESPDRALGFYSETSFTKTLLSDSLDTPEASTGPAKWIAAVSRYFVLAVVSQADVPATGQIHSANGGAERRANLVYPVTGNEMTIPFRVYFGPKDLKLLHEVEPTLDLTVDLGWFTFVAYPLLKLLKAIYSFVGNYGVAIMILTLIVKLLTLPLSYKAAKSMKAAAKFQPQIKKLQEKHKDDPQTLNREMMAFMKTHKYNPMAGCWPMFAQMPVFFALYRVLYSAVELYQAPFGLWLHDLSAKDPYYVLPILVSLTWYLQQRISPQTITDPMQRRMMQFMPLFFGVFMITLPSGLGIYFLVNAVTSIIQQVVFNKKLGLGGTTGLAPVT